MFPWVWLVGVTVWDSGWYYCELENDIDNPVTLKHNLQVTGTYISNIDKTKSNLCKVTDMTL